MNTHRLLLLIGLGLLVILIGGVFAYLFSSDPCSNSILSAKPSPNGELKAVIFTRDCGATTAYSRQVSIVPASTDLPNVGGKVFVAKGEPELEVTWINDASLTISGGGDKSPFPVSGFPGIHITYR